MNIHRKMLFAGVLLLSVRAGAMENVYILSDTVAHFERTFGVRAAARPGSPTGRLRR